MDAHAVVFEFDHKGILGGGVSDRITRIYDPEEQNQILYSALMKRCTDDRLLLACDVIIAVKGHAKMNDLGNRMKKMLRSKCTVRMCMWHMWDMTTSFT